MKTYYKARLITTNEIIEVKFNDGWIRWTEPKAWLNREEFEILEEIPQEADSPKQVTIEGWVLRDDNNKIGIYRDKPTCDEDGWDLTGESYELFPDITPVTEPKRYRITITPIEEN